MEILLILPGFILALMVIYDIKFRKPRNKVHFYVARDKNGALGLYLNKPIVHKNIWVPCKHGFYIGIVCKFEKIGLNEANYKDLKFEDKPVEVFLNLED